MLRRAASRLLFGQSFRGISASAARLAEEGAAAPAGPKEFADAWGKLAPSTLAVPEVPTNFAAAYKEGESAADGERFPVNFYTPHGVISEEKLDQVVLPGLEGYFGVKANHVPYVAQLKPGVVELHNGAEVRKWFISGGYAFVHPNSVTDVCVLEAATLDQVDGAAVKQALTAATAEKGGDEYETAINSASAELLQALDAALESKA